MVWNRWLLSNMAIFVLYIKFLGGMGNYLHMYRRQNCTLGERRWHSSVRNAAQCLPASFPWSFAPPIQQLLLINRWDQDAGCELAWQQNEMEWTWIKSTSMFEGIIQKKLHIFNDTVDGSEIKKEPHEIDKTLQIMGWILHINWWSPDFWTINGMITNWTSIAKTFHFESQPRSNLMWPIVRRQSGEWRRRFMGKKKRWNIRHHLSRWGGGSTFPGQ